MDILLAPDVYVNASVAGAGLAPEQVVNRVLGSPEGKPKITEWILARVAAMLEAHPAFKSDAIEAQLSIIRQHTDVVESGEHGDDAWADALVAGAKAAGIARVVTDHPDLADKEPVEDVEFLSTDAWMVEQTLPPSPPPPK